MRYAADHKPRTRDRIVEKARRAFLRNGLTGIGVDAIMRDAGMTAGGFYAHFASKNDLFALALDAAFESSMNRFLGGLDRLDGSEVIDTLTRRYLSRSHRDRIAESCPLTSLAVDAERAGQEARDIFETRIRERLATMAPALEARDDVPASEQALALLALYAGGIALSRVTAGSPLSNQILQACRKQARQGRK